MWIFSQEQPLIWWIYFPKCCPEQYGVSWPLNVAVSLPLLLDLPISLMPCVTCPPLSSSRVAPNILRRWFNWPDRADWTFQQVIGGGAVGLAIARKLASRDGTSTLLIERNSHVGMETSSRNSEVRRTDNLWNPKSGLCWKNEGEKEEID